MAGIRSCPILNSHYHGIKYFDNGGNSTVYKVKSKKDGSRYALKVLNRNDRKSRERFKREVESMIFFKEIDGVVSITDYNFGDCDWYVMPFADDFMEYTKDKSIIEKIEIFIFLSKVLCEIHTRGYTHRDIKPDNILVIENDIFISDFGLVNHPDFSSLTNMGEKVGNVQTIAPEMRYYDSNKLSDCKPADVYSLAKTMWIVITGDTRCFMGQYNEKDKYIAIKDRQGEINSLVNLHKLLYKCTDNNPSSRLDMNEFHNELINIIKIHKNPELYEKINRGYMIGNMNHLIEPDETLYVGVGKISEVLNIMFEKSVLKMKHDEKIFCVSEWDYTDGRFLFFNGEITYELSIKCISFDMKNKMCIIKLNEIENSTGADRISQLLGDANIILSKGELYLQKLV